MAEPIFAPVTCTAAAVHHCSCLHNASALQTRPPSTCADPNPPHWCRHALLLMPAYCLCMQAMPLWAVLNMNRIACAMLTCSAQPSTMLLQLTAAHHAPALPLKPASISAVERHTVRQLSSSRAGTTALQAMPFLAMVTFTLVVCTIANMLSTVQDHFAPALNLDAKMVILISCTGGMVCSALLVALTPMVHRKYEAALQSDSQQDKLKASGKVRQLCRARRAVVCRPAWQSSTLLQAGLQQQVWCYCSAAYQLPAAG